ncbi:hypothetical protein Ccrd_000916, partial [Cynara cardunculus var. scolymus]
MDMGISVKKMEASFYHPWGCPLFSHSMRDLEELECEINETIEWPDENPDADTDELEEKEMELD